MKKKILRFFAFCKNVFKKIKIWVSLWIFRRDPAISQWLKKQKPSLESALENSSEDDLKKALDLVKNSSYYLSEDDSLHQTFGFNSSPFYDPYHRNYLDCRRKKLIKKITSALWEKEAQWWEENFFNQKDWRLLIKDPKVLYTTEDHRNEIHHWHDGFYGEGFLEVIPEQRSFHLVLEWQGRKFIFDEYATIVLKKSHKEWEYNYEPFLKDNIFKDVPSSSDNDIYNAIIYRGEGRFDYKYRCETIKNILYVLVYNNFLADDIISQK